MNVKFICCLCLGPCNDYKFIQNENGESNEVYEVTVKYFDPMILSEDQDENSLNSSARVLCSLCWVHIYNFHEFQVSVLSSRNLLNEVKGQKIDMYPTQEMPNVATYSKYEPSDECLSDEKQVEISSDINDDIPIETLIRQTRLKTRAKMKRSVEKLKSSPDGENVNNNSDFTPIDKDLQKSLKAKQTKTDTAFTTMELDTVKSEAVNTEFGEHNLFTQDILLKEESENDPLPTKVKAINIKGSKKLSNIIGSKKHSKPARNKKPMIVQEKEIKRSTEELKEKRKEDDLFIAQWKPLLDCDLCSTTVSNFDEMRDHFRTAHTTRYYIKCCERKFYRRYALISHIRLHVNPETYKCDICGKLSTTKHNLKLHKKIVHSQSRDFECDICHRLFNQKPNLERHLLIHVEGEKKFFCKECGRGYVLEIQLKSHIKSVHELNHICDQCGKICHGQGALKAHLKEHAGVKRRKFPCDICGVEIVSKIGLKRHKAAFHHDGSTAYVCGICGKVTSSENALRHHKKYVHEKNKKYKCTYCDKAFMRPKSLREHVASHTGVDLYQCPHCPQTFKVSANMHHHRKRAHPVEWEEARKNKLILPKVNIEQCTNQVVL